MTSMRFHHITLLALLGTIWGTQSCRDDVTDFRPYPASVGDITLTLAQVPDPSTHSVFDLDGLDRDTILTTPGGVRIFLTDTDQLFLDETGTPVPCSTCDDLKLEVTEVVKKGDILARRLPTATTDMQPMECVAIVHLKVSCENKDLKLLDDRYVKVQVPSHELKPGLGLWLGKLTDDDSLSGWYPSNNPQAVFWAEWPGASVTQTGYELITRDLGWLNAGALINEPTTTFCVLLPQGYDGENSQVYILLKNNRSVFTLQPGANFGEFCTDEVPVGFPAQLITISKLGGKLLLGKAETEIGSNANVKVDPEITSESEVIQFLRNL